MLLRIKLQGPERVAIPSTLDKAVEDFFNSDVISRQMPGRNDSVTVIKNGKKKKVQKKLFMMTVMEAIKQFKNENHDKKIGKSKFAILHPKNVVPISKKDHNVCCCSYHENFDMLLGYLEYMLF